MCTVAMKTETLSSPGGAEENSSASVSDEFLAPAWSDGQDHDDTVRNSTHGY
jgi:hypothetical protein